MEARMSNIIRPVLAAAGMTIQLLFSAGCGAQAQNIENGVGVVCETPAQVEEFIALRTDTRSAVEQINAQSKSQVCEILNIAFLVGAVVAESANDKGTWQIRKILVVGLIIGGNVSPVQPYQKYTAFIIGKASPI
jgi:hypothetical protein